MHVDVPTARRIQCLVVSVVLLPVVLSGCADERPAKPEPRTYRTVRSVGAPDCRRLTVPVEARQRDGSWSWSSSTSTWVERKGPWVPAGRTTRPATAKDCLRIIDRIPGDAALPDLALKQLTRCGAGDKKATGGDCFTIVDPAPADEDFPKLAGRKLLKFPVITLNLGDGASEIIADRSAERAEDWKAYQTFYTATGRRLGSAYEPEIRFYFAGDGHDHWHIRDFDQYEILDAGGKIVRRAEKHGYCLQDNTTYDTMTGRPGVPRAPVYTRDTACGEGLPQALTIIHGLSRGWGDTYPSDLPDQAIDITGLPDGDYTIDVHADAGDFVKESDEGNNETSIEVTITGDEVTVHPSTSVGGIH
jgi:hypothetical protein